MTINKGAFSTDFFHWAFPGEDSWKVARTTIFFLPFPLFLSGYLNFYHCMELQAIPEKVARNLKKKLPLSVSLKGPSGFMWVVGITARDNTLYFCHGWPEFVKNHFLQENDILFFKYNGDSLFDVLMFDGQSKCEKAASYFVRKCGHTDHDGEYQTKRKIGENSVEVIPTSPHCDVGGASPEKTDDDDVNKTPVGQPVISQASSKRVRRVNSSVKAVHTRRSLRSKELCTSFVENEKAKPGSHPHLLFFFAL